MYVSEPGIVLRTALRRLQGVARTLRQSARPPALPPLTALQNVIATLGARAVVRLRRCPAAYVLDWQGYLLDPQQRLSPRAVRYLCWEPAVATDARFQTYLDAELDAPVSGGVAGAERGTLAVMVGGDTQAFETCKPLLQHIGANIVHVGEIGSGCVAKLVNNMLAFVNAVAAYEGMLLGVKAGVDLQMIHDIVQASSGASTAMRAFPNKIFAGDFAPGFMIGLAHKDLRLALELGDELSVPLMMGSVCINFLREARANGRGGEDLCGLMRLLEEHLGIAVRVPRQTAT